MSLSLSCGPTFGARACSARAQRRQQQPGRRQAVLTRAASSAPDNWSYPSGGSPGGNPLHAEEHWASLFALPFMPATNNPATVEDAR